MRITIEKIVALYPCTKWSYAAIERYFAGRRYVQHTTLLRDEKISFGDRLWLAIELMDEHAQRLFVCDCADRALDRVEPDARSLNAVTVARRYAIATANTEELVAAWLASRVVRNDDTSAVAAAARAATNAASHTAFLAAARDAASTSLNMSAEKAWQVGRAIEYLDEVLS